MSYQFENRYVLSNRMIWDYVNCVVCKPLIRGCLPIFLLCALGCIGAISLENSGAASIFGAFTFISIVVGISAPVLTARQMRLPDYHIPGNGETVVQFGDRIRMIDCGVQHWFDYSEITAVEIFRSFSVLQVGKREAIILSPSGFSKGNPLEFWNFFWNKRPDLWLEHKHIG